MIRVLLLTAAAALVGGGTSPRPPVPVALPNDNRVAAGSLESGVLRVTLEARRAMWHPNGDSLPGIEVETFGEPGKAPQAPGPLIRIPAQAPQGPSAAAGTMQVRIPAAPLYKEGRDVALNRVTLRRVRFAPIKKDVRIAYLKVELWITNTDIDACAQPELGEIPDFPLTSDTSFVLVWQGADLGKLETLHQTFVGSTVFAESWKDVNSKPAVLVWSTSGLAQLRELFESQPVELAGIIEQSFQRITLVPKGIRSTSDSVTFAWVMNHSRWAVFHPAAKSGRQDELSSSSVKISKGTPAPMVKFFGRPRSAGVAGTLPPIHLCPGVVEERRHFWDDKPAKKTTP